MVILHVLPFQVQMSHWISFHRPHTWILFALWFKTMILHVLQFQLQMSNWITFHRPRTWILFALWFKTALQNDFVVILHDLLHDLKSRCQIEPFAAVLTMKSCFSFIHENSFKDLWCFPWVFLFNLKFQYQYLIFFFDTYQFQYLEKLLWNMTLWWWYMSWIFKSRCQIEPLVTCQTHESCSLFDSKLICNMTLLMIIHFLHFQVQISNWTSCHSENVWILLALWFNTTLQYDFVVIIHVLDFQVQMSNWTSCHKPNT